MSEKQTEITYTEVADLFAKALRAEGLYAVRRAHIDDSVRFRVHVGEATGEARTSMIEALTLADWIQPEAPGGNVRLDDRRLMERFSMLAREAKASLEQPHKVNAASITVEYVPPPNPLPQGVGDVTVAEGFPLFYWLGTPDCEGYVGSIDDLESIHKTTGHWAAQIVTARLSGHVGGPDALVPVFAYDEGSDAQTLRELLTKAGVPLPPASQLPSLQPPVVSVSGDGYVMFDGDGNLMFAAPEGATP